VQQVSFNVGTLANVQRVFRKVREANCKVIDPRCHGNAWSVYFSDPSSRYGPDPFTEDLLEPPGSGRLLAYRDGRRWPVGRCRDRVLAGWRPRSVVCREHGADPSDGSRDPSGAVHRREQCRG